MKKEKTEEVTEEDTVIEEGSDTAKETDKLELGTEEEIYPEENVY